jgi:hypothetical protein
MTSILVCQVDCEFDKTLTTESCIEADRVLEEVARCAMYDVCKLFYPDGNPKAISELDDDIATALVSVNVSTVINAQSETTRS